jgi:hypothetical protein
VTEVIAHQPLDALPGRVARVAQAFRRDLLQLVPEDIVVALGFEVEDRAHAQQKLLGVVERSGIPASTAEEGRVRQLRDGLCAKEIAQGAWRLPSSARAGRKWLKRAAVGDERLRAPNAPPQPALTRRRRRVEQRHHWQSPGVITAWLELGIVAPGRAFGDLLT